LAFEYLTKKIISRTMNTVVNPMYKNNVIIRSKTEVSAVKKSSDSIFEKNNMNVTINPTTDAIPSAR
jgi:hypothetical protein